MIEEDRLDRFLSAMRWSLFDFRDHLRHLTVNNKAVPDEWVIDAFTGIHAMMGMVDVLRFIREEEQEAEQEEREANYVQDEEEEEGEVTDD